MSPRIITIVPAHNEEARLTRVIRGIPSSVSTILVINDASSDRTRLVAENTGDPRVTVLTHPRNLGVGAAIVTGYRYALTLTGDRHDAFVVMAGDAQMDPDDLPALTAPITTGAAGYVKGNRFVHAAAKVMPLGRRLGGEFFSRATSLAIGQRITDSQCGFTAISREACERIDFSQIWPRYGYPNDLLGALASKQIVIREVPVRPIYAGEASGLTWRHLPRIMWIIGRAGGRRVLKRSHA